MQIFHIFIDPLASCCSFLVARSVGPFVAQIDTDAAQSVPQVQLNFLHHYHTNSPNYSNFSYPPYNSLMESLLRNVCVPPLTSRQMAIVFTGSEFFIIKAVFLLSETEMSKVNAKFVFFVAVFIDYEKLVVLGLHAL